MSEAMTVLLALVLAAIGAAAGFFVMDRQFVQRLRDIRGRLVESIDVLAASRTVADSTLVERVERLSRLSLYVTLALVAVAMVDPLATRWLGENLIPSGGQPWRLWIDAGQLGCALGGMLATAGAQSEKARILSIFETLAAARTRLESGASELEINENTRITLAKERRETKLFLGNLVVDSTLTYLELENMALFSDLAWRLDPGVNILLGRNGYGKSLLLRLLAAAVANDAATLRRISGPEAGGRRLLLHLQRDGQMVTSTHESELFEGELGPFPLLAIPDSRFIDRSRSTLVAEDDELADLARTGARRFLEDRPFDSAIQTVLAQMCIDAMELGQGGVTRPSTPQLDLVAEVVRALSEEEFRFHRVESAGSGRFRILVETSASPEQPIGIHQASQGTLSVVAIFGLIYQFLRVSHPSVAAEDLCGSKGIVLIDEIDAHLHPAWQRQIVPLLRERFPAVQFVLTAHSPLIVGGCGRGEVSVLVREGDRLRVVEHQRDFIGASFDEIYSEIFEIEERDVTYLALNAKVPRLPELRREVEALKARSGVDQALIDGKLETIGTIERLRRDEEQQLDEQQLRREHEQYRLENIELRRRLEQPEAASNHFLTARQAPQAQADAASASAHEERGDA